MALPSATGVVRKPLVSRYLASNARISRSSSTIRICGWSVMALASFAPVRCEPGSSLVCPTRDPSKGRQPLSRLSCILSALFVATAGAALGGCAVTFASRAPAAVDLSGEWQIDLVFSDSSQQAVPVQDVLAATTTESGTSGSGQGGRGGRGGRGRGMAGGGMPPASGQGQGPGRAGFPEHRFAMPPHLSITQD